MTTVKTKDKVEKHIQNKIGSGHKYKKSTYERTRKNRKVTHFGGKC
jgi:hypothetical protein